MPPQNRSKVPIGTILEGKFRVSKEIGRGGMAAVYEAENVDIGKRVAVKILAAELIASRVVRERFIREARAAAAIRSPYICDVYDSGMYEDRPFLVMELLEGESLYDLMTRVRRLSPELTLKVTTHTARGLAKAHEANVIHRDLKPENIFLTKNEEGETIAKIVDFGLAKFYEPTGGDAAQARLTREGALFGTPAYMSPEQARGQGEVDHRCDLWALGCIVYECLTGQTVWNVDQGVAMILAQIAGSPLPRPSRLRPDLPPTFDAWFAKALDRDPDRRFQTPREFADSLAEALLGPARSPGKPISRTSVPSHVVDSLDTLLPPRTEPPPIPTTPAPPPVPSPLPPSSSRDRAPLPVALAAPIPPTAPAALPVAVPTVPPPRNNVGRAIALLLGAAALALAGYALWFYVLHPVNDRSTDGSPEQPLDPEPYAAQIGEGQESLTQGKAEVASQLFRAAYRTGGSGVARALLSHTDAVLEEKEGLCRTSGLGRPRPFAVSDPASRPTIAVSSAGPIVAWVDTHQDPKRRQAFTALLDGSLRRASPAHLVTPEASSVRHPQLFWTGRQLGLIYWEGAGDEPGVYLRPLSAEGRMTGPVRRLSRSLKNEFYPTLAQGPQDGFWAAWSEAFEDKGEDLVIRRVSSDLAPLGEPVRVTALGGGPKAPSVGKPDLSITARSLFAVFSVEHSPGSRDIVLLRIALDDPALAKGLASGSKLQHLGARVTLTRAPGRFDQPRLVCSDEGCHVVWDDEANGAVAAYVDARSLVPIWQNPFGAKGARPAVGRNGEQRVVAFYDSSRLKLAKINRDGLSPASIVAKVSGYQPYPSIHAGSEAGQWYISFRDYESGHLEVFVVRAQCQ